MVLVKKINSKILCIASLMFCALQNGHPQTAGIDSATASFGLRCTIPDLHVYLDNRFIAKTPLPKKTLLPGIHTVRVQNPTVKDWLSRDWESTFSIRANENRIFDVQFDRVYWLGSSPSGASIIHGDHLLDKTPAAITLSEESNGCIVLKHPGYQPLNIDLTKQSARMLHLRLEKNDLDKTMSAAPGPRYRRGKTWIIGGGIIALASGIAGYCYKNKAEKAYQNYLTSGHLEEMDRHFNDSKKYDTCSAILYGIGEMSLGITLFITLWGNSKD
jgi:hypothetical protein